MAPKAEASSLRSKLCAGGKCMLGSRGSAVPVLGEKGDRLAGF